MHTLYKWTVLHKCVFRICHYCSYIALYSQLPIMIRLLWGFGSFQWISSPLGVHHIVPEKRNYSLLPHLLLSLSFQKILLTISWMAINVIHTVGIIAKVSRMNQIFCTYVLNDATMLVKVFCTCARDMKTAKPVMILGYKRRWNFNFFFLLVVYLTDTRMQVDNCFRGRSVCSGGLIRWTGRLEEISPCKFVKVLAPLEFAFKLSSGTQQPNFTQVSKTGETIMKN